MPSASNRLAPTSTHLYLVLSWLIAAYYVIIVSKGMSLDDNELSFRVTSPFLPAVRGTRHLSQLLSKHFTTLNSGDITKLRRVSSNVVSRKKTSMNHLEVFVCVCICSSVQTLRSVISLVKVKLLKAGDIEVNPGPETQPSAMDNAEQGGLKATNYKQLPLRSKSTSLTDLRTKTGSPLRSLSSPVNDKDPEATDIPIHGQINPHQASEPPPPTSVRKLDTVFQVPSSGVPVHLGGVNPFVTEKSGSEHIDLQDSKFPPPTEVVSPRKNFVYVGQQPAGTDQDASHGSAQTAKHKKHMSAQHLTLSQISDTPSRKKLRLKLQKEVLELRPMVSDIDHLDQAESAKRLFKLFTAMNKLYRLGEKCPICPICLKEKKESGGQRNSHVIPQTILKHYWEIHGVSEETAFILDFSRNENLSAGGLTYQLLCGDCETFYSDGEESLLHIYLCVTSDPHTDVIIEHKELRHTSRLRYILANIMFRGILAHIDVDERFRDTRIVEKVYNLWRFCHRDSSNQCDNLKVFLLPNKPFNEDTNTLDILYPFEILLRMPQCTVLVQHEKLGAFFYTKFDCFHVVLPLCDLSQIYFDSFNNGLTEIDRNLHLRMTIRQQAEISYQGKNIICGYSPGHARLKDHFPEALLGWCASLCEPLISKLFNHPPIKKSFQTVVDRYHGAQYAGFNTDDRMKMSGALTEWKFVDQRASRTLKYEHLKDKHSIFMRQASEHSPFKRSEIAQVKQKLRELKAELKQEKVAHAESRKILGDTRKELGDTRKELGDLRQESEGKDNQIVELQIDKERIKESERRAVLELWSTRTELHDTQVHNSTLQEIQCEGHKEDLEITKQLYRTSLRKHATDRSIEILQQLIYQRASRFEKLMIMTQESDSFLAYKELYEEYSRLLRLSPPTSPTPMSHM